MRLSSRQSDATASTGDVFRGPVFVVGLPRSGTKLLRELLNNHPRIAIPPAETDVLPQWARRWPRYGDLSDRARFEAFVRDVGSAPFFVFMRECGHPIDAQDWYQHCRGFGVAEVFEALVRVGGKRGERGLAPIWGDKSPSYIEHVPLLVTLFPNARFVHIVRDVRDYCLSINAAWGKQMLRAAQRWSDSVQRFRADCERSGAPALELRYEDLLDDPRRELGRACAFLGVDFMPALLELADSPENLGAARGQRRVLGGNQGKYLSAMPPRLRRQVESIAKTALLGYGYPVADERVPLRLPAWRLALYQALDAVSLLRFEVAERGWLGALRFRWGAFRVWYGR